MKKMIIPFLLIAFVFTACNMQEQKQAKENEEEVLAAQEEIKPNTLTKQELDDGWILMFNGITSDGWRSHNSETFPEHGWIVENGTLHVIGSGRGEAGGDRERRSRAGAVLLEPGTLGSDGIRERT